MEITPLRKKRLLLLARCSNAHHKRWYSYYLHLMADGLITWNIGNASLTTAGQQELDRLSTVFEILARK